MSATAETAFAAAPGRLRRGGIAGLTVASYAAQGTRLALSVLVAQVFGPVGRGAVALMTVLDEASSVAFT
ncbi:MAG TPA: hypothetical protein VIH47_02435, partial [Solirubrobacterales bacterium]